MMLVSIELEKLLLYRQRTRTHHAGRRGDHGAGRQAAQPLRAYRCYQRRGSRARAGPAARIAQQLRRRGRRGHRARLYMLAKTFRQMLVILREERTRFARDLAGAVAGFPHAAVCRRRPDRQARRYKSRRELTRALRADGQRRSGTALRAARQAAGVGATGDAACRQSGHSGTGNDRVAP